MTSHSHETHTSSHGSMKSYLIGFGLSLILTFSAFGAIMMKIGSSTMLLATIVILCVAQLVIQLIYFLHIGAARSQRANTGIFICTALLIAIIVAGSLWVMHNANINMMPTSVSVERAMVHD